MKSVLVVLMLMDVSPCGSHHHREANVPAVSPVDHSSPATVVAFILQVAMTGDTHHIAEVCDPSGNNSAYARGVCAQTKEDDHWEGFFDRFGNAEAETPTVSGDTATVVVKTRATADKQITTTLKLEKRATGWYLADQ